MKHQASFSSIGKSEEIKVLSAAFFCALRVKKILGQRRSRRIQYICVTAKIIIKMVQKLAAFLIPIGHFPMWINGMKKKMNN